MKKSNLIKQVKQIHSEFYPGPKIQETRNFVSALSNQENENYYLMKKYDLDRFEATAEALKLDLPTFKHEVNIKYYDYCDQLQ